MCSEKHTRSARAQRAKVESEINFPDSYSDEKELNVLVYWEKQANALESSSKQFTCVSAL